MISFLDSVNSVMSSIMPFDDELKGDDSYHPDDARLSLSGLPLNQAQIFPVVTFLNEMLQIYKRISPNDIEFKETPTFTLIDAKSGFGIEGIEEKPVIYFSKPKNLFVKDIIDEELQSNIISTIVGSLHQWDESTKPMNGALAKVFNHRFEDQIYAENTASNMEGVFKYTAMFHETDIDPTFEVHPTPDYGAYKIFADRQSVITLQTNEKFPGTQISRN